MDKVTKTLRKIKKMEGELLFASPKKAAFLTVKIVRLKGKAFDKTH